MNGRKTARTNQRKDPDYYKNIRKKRVNYPRHDGQFDSDQAAMAARRWDAIKRRNDRPGSRSED